MGGGRKSLLAFFGFTRKPYQGEEEAEPRHQRPRKVRRSDEDDRGHWYAEPDIDRKAKEYIEKIHRQMQLEKKDEDDHGHWYAEPDIDRKAKEYIEKIHRQMQLEKKDVAE